MMYHGGDIIYQALTKYLRWTIVSVLSVVTVLVLYVVCGETESSIRISSESQRNRAPWLKTSRRTKSLSVCLAIY
jgi:hypothetical protein